MARRAPAGRARSAPRRTLRGLLAALVCAGAGVGLASCGSSGPSALAACSSSSVTLAAGQGGAGLGHVGIAIVLRHRGSGACTLHGYPVLWGDTTRDAASYPAPAKERARPTLTGYLGGLSPGHTRAPTVTLRGSERASFYVEGLDFPPNGASEACTNFDAFVVTLPHSTSSVRISVTFPACIDPYVHPFVPGTTGILGT